MAGAAAKVGAWMPLWIGDILAETMGLTRDQIGGYMLLLFAYWRNKGPLPDDDEAFAAIVRASVDDWRDRLRPRLVPFFMLQACAWHHERTELELAKAGKNKAAAVEKARKAAEGRWGSERAKRTASGNAPSMPGADIGACVKDTPSPSPYSSSLRSEEVSASQARTEPATPAGKPKIEYANRALALPEWLLPHADDWRAFEELRWAKHPRPPYTAEAQRRLVQKLEGMHNDGQDLHAVLEASITGGWTDVYTQRQRSRTSGADVVGSRYAGAAAAVFGGPSPSVADVIDVVAYVDDANHGRAPLAPEGPEFPLPAQI